MAGRAGDDGGVNFCRGRRPRGPARCRGPAAAVPLAGILLSAILLSGCGAGAPAAGTAASRPGAAGTPGTADPVSTAASPSATVKSGSHSDIQKGSAGPATSRPAPGGPSSGPGCSRWPAGSTSTTLLLTQASNGRRYCVRPGQQVQVYLSGELLPRAGAEPPRLTGTGLVPAPSGQAHLLRSPADAYQAVQAGQVVLSVVRQPCRSLTPTQDPTPTPVAGGLGDPGAGAPARANAVELAWTGGAPVGAQCAFQQALRVTIVVP
jgi:hypothetical protein